MQDDIEKLKAEFRQPVTALGLRLAWIIAIIILVDQASKVWVLSALTPNLGDSVKILPFFKISMVHNEGISFGLLGSGGLMRWVLTVFQLVVAGLLTWIVFRVRRPLLGIAFALIAGGAIGNAIDRIRFGYVVDFLDFSGLFFPWVFNVADSAICIGIALLAWYFYQSERQAKAAPPQM
ncbi:signal peptidase II [Asticcacaulis biprosthecium C19]|uniref:Lipoprotein signal peptidase n=1 Tax=Asticcacaulis biprosthecium C19 TaxID=715226 RepID=F4QS33_9CAUL|nr:signal peptidase II [Asticcacaulis biprosthecium]EGF89553.1 signal peptidase II [Asticcacaulis biprosthecium C19]